MKSREPRHKVVIPARVKSTGGWQEACILNLSSRGAMVRAAHPLERGDTIELRRGLHRVIARVMWNQGQRCGVMSQDVIAVDEFIDHPGTPPRRRGDSGAIVERRRVPRALAERSCVARWVARLIEYGAIAGVGAVAAVVACAMLLDLFGRPIGAAGAVLSGEQVIAAR